MLNQTITDKRCKTQLLSLLSLVGVAAAFSLTGCFSSSSESKKSATVALSIADFSDPASVASTDLPPNNAAISPISPPTPPASQPQMAIKPMPTGLPEVTITPGPAEAQANATATGEGAEIDAKVGDINGRAIFASSFLEEMGPRMRAQADDLYKRTAGGAGKNIPAAQLPVARDKMLDVWREFAQVLTRNKLENELQVELLRAEAASSFTAEQRQGFFSFLQRVQEDLESESGGSKTRAGEKVNEEEGQTIDEYIKQRKTLELVRFQLQRKVFSRVNVSWRDVQLEYDKRPESYIEPPKAVFRVVLVRTEAESKEVEQKLAAGTSFVEIAQSKVNTFNIEKGGEELRTYNGPKESIEFFGPKPMNEAARKLSEGQWAGPFRVGNSYGFLFLEKMILDDRELYDVQLRVEDYLRSKRQNLETNRYIERLKQRASFTNLDEMSQKLVGFAQKRYFDPVFAPQ